MSKATTTGEEPDSSAATEIIVSLDRIAHEKRLGNLIEVAKVIGLDRVDTDGHRRQLIDAFRSFEGVLFQIQLVDDQEPLRRALHDANPEFTPEQIDQLVKDRLGGLR